MATTEEDITVKPTRAAPYAPRQGMSTTYVMSADDTSLHFDINALTPKQIEEFESHKDLMGFLQVALIGLGKPDDHVMLYEAFGQKPWHARLKRYEGFLKRWVYHLSLQITGTSFPETHLRGRRRAATRDRQRNPLYDLRHQWCFT